MHANSSPVVSRQTAIHAQLAALVARHASHPFRKPITDYNHAAFEQGVAAWQAAGCRPLIIDAGCGVGLSTMHLAAQFPGHFVMGIDQSADRLARHTLWPGTAPENFICLRADLVDYWRLLLQHGIHPARHYILYPNPWPKPAHLARRWHGHPVFPAIAALGGLIECRSNWRIYIAEFAAAMSQLSELPVACEAHAAASPITPFERKYTDSGHALWRCALQLPVRSTHAPENMRATV